MIAHVGASTTFSTRADLEHALAGALVAGGRHGGKDVGAALSELSEAVFAHDVPRAIYNAVAAVHVEGVIVDPVAVLAALASSGDLERIGGQPAIADTLDKGEAGALLTYVRALNDWHGKDEEEKSIKAEREKLSATVREVERLLKDPETPNGLVRSVLADRLAELRVADPTDDAGQLVRLSDLLANPTITAPPEAVATMIAWRGRTTLFAAREKSGKSTVAAYAAAVKSRGGWCLGEKVEAGRVIVLCLEEHPGDVARNLMRFGANPDNVWILRHIDGGFEALRRMIEEIQPDLVVIDTLEEFVKQLGLVMQAGDDPQWTGVMSNLRDIAHDLDVALVIIHHASKSDGRARGSTRITAGVEAVLEMSVDEATGERRVRSVARWSTKPFSLVLKEGEPDEVDRFELAAGQISLDARMLAFIEENPGCSKRTLRDGVKGATGTLDRLLDRLLNTGVIVNRGTGSGHAYFKASHGRVTLGVTLENREKDSPGEAA